MTMIMTSSHCCQGVGILYIFIYKFLQIVEPLRRAHSAQTLLELVCRVTVTSHSAPAPSLF